VKEFRKALNSTARHSFAVQASRDQAMAAWNAMVMSDDLFTRSKRFPETANYINLNQGEWPRRISQLITSLEFKDIQVAGVDQDTAGYGKSHVAYNSALAEMRTAIGLGEGVHNRLSFEQTYSLQWV